MSLPRDFETAICWSPRPRPGAWRRVALRIATDLAKAAGLLVSLAGLVLLIAAALIP